MSARGTNCVGALSCTRIETYFYTDSGFSDACPAGKIITGGGCICGSNGVVELTIPTTPLNQWYCMCNAAATNRAYGICC